MKSDDLYTPNNINPLNRMKKFVIFLLAILLFLPILFAQEDINSYCVDNITLRTNITISGEIIPIEYYCAFGCDEIQHRCNDNPYSVKSTTIFDTLVIVFFIGNLLIMFAKIYNIAKLTKGYDMIFIFTTMVFSFFSWLIMVVYLSLKPGIDISFWLQITTFIMLINFFMMVIEIIILWTTTIAEKKPKTRGRLLRKMYPKEF